MMNFLKAPKPVTQLDEALAKCRRVFIYLLGYSLVHNLLMLILPIYSLQVLDRVLSSGSIETLFFLSLLAFGAIAFLGLLSVARTYVLIRASEWLDKVLTPVFLKHTLTAGSRERLGSGSEHLRELAKLRQFIGGNGIMSLLDIPWAPIFILSVFFINPILGIIVLGGGVVLFALTFINESATRQPLGQANAQASKSMAQVDQAVQHADAIRAMGMEKAFIKRWLPNNEKAIGLQNIASRRSAIVLSISRSFRMLLQILIMGGGSWLVLSHQVSVGGVIAASILAGKALAPFEQSISTWMACEAALSAYRSLQQTLLQSPKEVSPVELPAPQGSVQLEAVMFVTSPSRRTILKNISFNLAPGESLGIIGPSAAGKSTLLKLMAGILTPTTGNVRLDRADFSQWKKEQLSVALGYMPQEVGLFEGTVRDNIARLQAQVEDKSVVDAAMMAGAHEMILRLPAGYDTEVGYGGSLLSAGQRQRIGLARAYFGVPKLILLDEPNSNLDSEGEAALVHALQQAKAARSTVVVVTHKPNILQFMDNILILNEGAVVDFGRAEMIMRKLAMSQQRTAQPQPHAQPQAPGAAL